jgi:type II secretory ATPase GspE/PulE/Tfp pilus assembly ATPase PilB-like protein
MRQNTLAARLGIEGRGTGGPVRFKDRASAESAVAPVRVAAVTPYQVLAELVSSGGLADADRERAVELARTTGTALPIVLDRLGLIAQVAWAEETARMSGLAMLRADEFPDPLPMHPRLSGSFLLSRCVAPIETGDEVCRFAAADPSDVFVIKALEVATGCAVEFVVAPYRDIEAVLTRAAQVNQNTQVGRDRGRDQQDADYLIELANDAPTIKLVDRIFAAALEREATDIHVEAFDRATRLRFRIDGVLVEQAAIPTDLYPAVVSRLKILAGLDIAERRLPQDGRIRHRSHGREFDLRVATAPAIHGETIALRILNHASGLKQIGDLGIPTKARATFDWGLQQRNGLILVTGPTGSGKTTTLNAALSELNTVGRKVVSVENPVEVQVPGVVQLESNSDIGLDFARALRSFLRHDPDVMMVGEIRDRETAEVAIQAALTGHLVLSTLHTNDAPSAIARLEDMGVQRFLIDATLRFSAAQRLVRTLCLACARPSQRDELGYRLAAGLATHGGVTHQPREAVGCAKCGGTGYRGRRAVFEAITGAEIGSPSTSLTYEPMRVHAVDLVAAGITSAQEAMRVIDIPEAADL